MTNPGLKLELAFTEVIRKLKKYLLFKNHPVVKNIEQVKLTDYFGTCHIRFHALIQHV